MEAVFENFQESFDPLNPQLLENAMQELYRVSKSAILFMMKKKKFKRLESQLNILQNYILHLHIKNSTSHENDAVVRIEYRDLFLRLLSCLMDAYLLGSIKNEMYIQRAVQDLRLYTGSKTHDICVVLLHCSVIRKAYSAFCQPLLKHLLSVIPDDLLTPKEYVRYLLLLRTWKVFADNSIVKASIIDLASKLKAASGLKEFLSIFKQDGQSLFVLSGSNRKFARHFLCKKFPPGCLKDMRQILCEDTVSITAESAAAREPLYCDNIEKACFSGAIKKNTKKIESEIQSSIIFHTQTLSSNTDDNDTRLPTSSQEVRKNETDQFSSFFIDTDGGSLTPDVNKSIQRKMSYLRTNSHIPESKDGDDKVIETANPIGLSLLNKNGGTKDSYYKGDSKPEKIRKKRIKKNQCKVEANQLDISPQDDSKRETQVISFGKISSCELINKNDSDMEPDYKKTLVLSSVNKNECQNARQKKKGFASSSKKETIERKARKICIASSDISEPMVANYKKKQHVSFRVDEDYLKKNPKEKNISYGVDMQPEKHVICDSEESSKKPSVDSCLTVSGIDPLICDNKVNVHESDLRRDYESEVTIHTSDKIKSSSNSLEKSLLRKMKNICSLKKSLVDNRPIAETDDSHCSGSAKTSRTSDEINVISNSTEELSENTKEVNFSDHCDMKWKKIISNEIGCPSKHLSTCSKNSLGEDEMSDCLSDGIAIISNPSDKELPQKLKMVNNYDANENIKKSKKKGMEISTSNVSVNNSTNSLICEEIGVKYEDNCTDDLEKITVTSDKESHLVSDLVEKSHSASLKVVNYSKYDENKQKIQNNTFMKPVSNVSSRDNQDTVICVIKDSESNTDNNLNGTSHGLDEISDILDSLKKVSPVKSKITNSDDEKKKSSNVTIKKHVKSVKTAQFFSDNDSETGNDSISKHVKISHISDGINVISDSPGKELSSESRKCNYLDKDAEERAEGKRSANAFLSKSIKRSKKMRICNTTGSESDLSDDVGQCIKSSCTSDEINVISDSPEREALCKSVEMSVSDNGGEKIMETNSENITLNRFINSSKITRLISENDSESNNDDGSKHVKTSCTSDEINIISDSSGKESELAKVENISNTNALSPRLIYEEKSKGTLLSSSVSLNTELHNKPFQSNIPADEVVCTLRGTDLCAKIIESDFSLHQNVDMNASNHVKGNSPPISNTNAKKIAKLGLHSNLKNMSQPNKLITETTNIRSVIRDIQINLQDCRKTTRVPKPKEESSSKVKEQVKNENCLFKNRIVEDKTKENNNGNQNSAVISNSEIFHIKFPVSDVKFPLLSDSCRNKSISRNISVKYSATGPLRQSARIKERSTPWKCMGPDFSDLGKFNSKVSKMSLINIISPNSKTHRTLQNNDSFINNDDDEIFHTPSTSDCETDAVSVVSANSEVQSFCTQREKEKEGSELFSGTEATLKSQTDDCSSVGFSLMNMVLDSDVGKVLDMLPSNSCDCQRASVEKINLKRSTRTRKGSSSSINSLTQNGSDDEGGSQKLMRKAPSLTSLHEIIEIPPDNEKSEANLKIKEKSDLLASPKGKSKGYNLRTRKQLVKPAKFL